MSWASRAANNLLPLSRERDSLVKALHEWRYTGNFNDLEAPIEECELCDHPEIRYQFEIKNQLTGSSLLVGSECIHRFNIAATDEEGHTLDREATHQKVERDRRHLIEEARKRRVIRALVALAHLDTDFKILSFVDYFQTRGAFTPKQLVLLLWRLSKLGVDHNPRDFKLTIKRKREKAQLELLEEWQLEKLQPCLSESQKVYLKKHEDNS